MIWNVEGADVETGEDRFVQIKAHTQEEAEQEASRQGLLVSGVYATRSKKPIEPYKPRPALLDEAVVPVEADESVFSPIATPSEPSIVPAPPVSVAYQSLASAVPREVPETPAYTNLRVAAALATVAAGVCYAVGFALLVYGIADDFSLNPKPFILAKMRGLLDVTGVEWSVANLSMFFIAGVVLHVIGATARVLKDIARNSFRN